MSQAQVVPIALDERSYEIIIGQGIFNNVTHSLLPLLVSSKAVLVADETLVNLYALPLQEALKKHGVACTLIPIKGGEKSKQFSAFQMLLDKIFEAKPDRKTSIIALGGGVIGDAAGFAASVVLRGVPFIQIPTTLLAQIDSSVGGKTGINSSYGKNTVGAFYQPKGVLIDIQTLESLPAREMKAGYAEMLKYALLGDVTFLSWLEENGTAVLARESGVLSQAIARCCAMKADIVAEDEREAGKRALLNLGHTFGHALEAEAAYDGSLLHGESVSIGMLLAAQLSEKLGYLSNSEVLRIETHMQEMGLVCKLSDIDKPWNIDALMTHMGNDKKAQDGTLVLVVPKALGRAAVVKDVDASLVREVWREAM